MIALSSIRKLYVLLGGGGRSYQKCVEQVSTNKQMVQELKESLKAAPSITLGSCEEGLERFLRVIPIGELGISSIFADTT